MVTKTRKWFSIRVTLKLNVQKLILVDAYSAVKQMRRGTEIYPIESLENEFWV